MDSKRKRGSIVRTQGQWEDLAVIQRSSEELEEGWDAAMHLEMYNRRLWF